MKGEKGAFILFLHHNEADNRKKGDALVFWSVLILPFKPKEDFEGLVEVTLY